jgi:Fe-S oxidoreductase
MLAAAGVAFVYALRMRYEQLIMGKRPDVRWDELPKRVRNVFIYVIGQARLPKNGYLYSGILHIFIFGAFMVLSVDTINFVVDGLFKSYAKVSATPLVELPFGVDFHLPFTDLSSPYQALADSFRFLCIVGLMMAFANRIIIKPDRLPLTRDAMYTLFFILGLMVFEVTQQGFLLAHTEANEPHIWFSSIFASLVQGLHPDTLKLGHQISWWVHLALLLSFTNYVPWSKHSHVFAAPFNILFMSLEPKGALSKMDLGLDAEPEVFTDEFVVGEAVEGEGVTWTLTNPADPSGITLYVNDKKFRRFDFDETTNAFSIKPEKMPDAGAQLRVEYEGPTPDYFGVRNLEDLSWKQLFDGLSCTECGRCNDNCPASMSGKPLNPMDIIVDIKHHMVDRFNAGEAAPDLANDEKLIMPGGVIDPDVLWSCTTCRACMEVCPVGNEHIPDIVDMRRYLTMSLGEVGHGGQKALKAMDRKRNPWGMSPKDREQWTEDMDTPVKRWDAEEPSEYLYWVGCAGAYDDRAKKVTRSVSRLMDKAGIDFAIMGNEEKCTGDSARRLGDEYLFQTMANENVENLNSAGVKKIVTHCPHCMNTLKNEYSQFGGDYEVIHHTELLSKLVSEGKLTPKAESEDQKKVIYHDLCYLGRYNDIYDPQRDIIDAMPDVERVEADRSKATGLCCGAGGGQMWMEVDIGERMNYVRTDQLLEKEPKVIAVACNFCMTMIDDGVKAKGKEEDVEILDLAELLDRRVE